MPVLVFWVLAMIVLALLALLSGVLGHALTLRSFRGLPSAAAVAMGLLPIPVLALVQGYVLSLLAAPQGDVDVGFQLWWLVPLTTLSCLVGVGLALDERLKSGSPPVSPGRRLLVGLLLLALVVPIGLGAFYLGGLVFTSLFGLA